MKTGYKFILFAGLVSIGFAIGYFSASRPQYFFTNNAEQHTGEDGLINPLLQCDIGEEYISKNSIKPFKPALDQLIDSEKSQGNITFASVYFRDLNNGTWFGNNINEQFYPASLLKLPVLLAVLSKADHDPSFLSQKIQYINTDTQEDVYQYYKPKENLVSGQTYTIKELSERMIRYSDNKAAETLVKVIGQDALLSVFKEVGIETPPSANDQDFLTTRQYASFFRILFNASFLSREYSQAALSLLSSTTFTQGIVAGVPSGIIVANKFGEKSDDTGTAHQLHDCGIIYYPKHPYLLCVMTRGNNFDTMVDSIRKISKTTYEQVDSQLSTN